MVIFRFSTLHYPTMLSTVKHLYLLISVLAGLWQRTTSLYGSQTSLHSILISLFFHFHRNVPHSFSLFDCISLPYLVFQDKVFLVMRLKDFSWPLYYFQNSFLIFKSELGFAYIYIQSATSGSLSKHWTSYNSNCNSLYLPFFRHLHSIKSKPVKHLRAKG